MSVTAWPNADGFGAEVSEVVVGLVTPIAVKLIVCGLSGALSVIVTCPVRVPTTAGVKVTEMLQLPPAGMDVPQLLVSAKSPLLAPLTLMDEMASVPLPVLVRVETCVVLVVPTVWLPKLRIRGEIVTTAPTPTPESGTVWGLPGAFSLTLADPLREPDAFGVNVTVIVQVAPAVRLEPQLFCCEKSLEFGPVTAIEEICSHPPRDAKKKPPRRRAAWVLVPIRYVVRLTFRP
jgi:hypothetical protein